MDKFESQLKADLSALAEGGGDAATEQRVLARSVEAGLASTRSYWRPVLGALAGAAAVAVGLAVLNMTNILGASDSSTITLRGTDNQVGSHTTIGNQGPAGLAGPGEPCPGAVHGSLSNVALRTSIPIWTPASSADEPLTDSWTCADTPVLVFSGDIQVSYEAGWSSVDIAEKFAALAKDYGGTVGTVLGRPALIQSADDTGDNNQVLVVVGDTLIRVLATDSVQVDRLVALANSLQLQTPR